MTTSLDMTHFLIAIAVIITVLNTINSLRQKKKLSDEDLIEFERNIKPKIVRLIFFLTLPTLAICFHVATCTLEINKLLIFSLTLLSFVISVLVYFRTKTIITHTGKQKEYNYVLNYLLLYGLTHLMIIAALTSLFSEYLKK